VRLMKDGVEVKMSKRAGTYVTLEEVVDEVGLDVARFFFLMHRPSTHMDFDMTLAKEKSEKNPVFYVQYAHARISSMLKKVGKLPRVALKESPHTSELNLVKTLLQLPSVIREVADTRETQKLPFYAIELATKFHEFYTHCRVIDENRVWIHRLELVKATQMVLQKTLKVIGVSAPEKM
jgi:arginyl-tRNA synthetase